MRAAMPLPALPSLTRRRFGTLLLGTASLPAAADTPRVAPPLSATLLDGRGFSLQQASGQVLIVNFWATWCAPCRVELAALEAFRQRHAGRGLRILAISLDEPRQESAVRVALQSFGFDAALAARAAYEGYGRIWRVPTSFVIDRQGRLRSELSPGAEPVDLVWLERHVAPLLAG
jgi:cytochrome c biogenesis protein CcmG/thiol:disulfide interchange protein DsbE